VKVLEFLQGTGIVTAPNGEGIRAKYDLQITLDDPEGETGGVPVVRYKHISGHVWSEIDPYFVSAHARKIMMLQMEDGRKLNFFHREMDGSIGLSKWIG
jgi:hypothetical protein